MVIIDTIKRRLHRDIVADPVLHGLTLNLFLNGEQYPHRVTDYFPMEAAADAELAGMMRRHMADEDRHIALYMRAIEKLGQPVLQLPLQDIFNEVIRGYTPQSFAIAHADDPDTKRCKLAHFFAHLHFLEKRVARSLEYHVGACAHATSPYAEKAISVVLRDEMRHVAYTREVVLHLLPRAAATEILALHARAERRANLDFSATQLRRLLRAERRRFPRAHAALYGSCAILLKGALACA